MSRSFVGFERQRLVRCQLLEEIRRRRLPGAGGWSHGSAQFGTEPTSLALVALYSPPSGSTATAEDLAPLIVRQLPNGLWPAGGDGAAGGGFWASSMAGNTLMFLGAASETLAASLDALLRCRPLEASWLVRLKFRFSDRQVRFDPTKYGWPWVPDTVSWVVPTSMALITLERAKRQGLIWGSEFKERMRLGAEMLLDRACPESGWNAGNGVVYGVPLRPHIDATALALAAHRFHYHLPIVRRLRGRATARGLPWRHLRSSGAEEQQVMTTPGLAKFGRPGGLFQPVRHFRRPAPVSPFVRIPKTSPPSGPLLGSLGDSD